jgi:hypothetical protein
MFVMHGKENLIAINIHMIHMNADKFDRAVNLFDVYNASDPHKEIMDNKEISASLAYAYRMTEKLREFEPQASEALQLAARSQHIGRWEIPRSKFPKDKTGYLRWRSQLKKHHAEIASKLMKEAGYEDGIIKAVSDLLLKKQLKQNPDMQTLEDVICLVFMQYYLDDFSGEVENEKLVNILKKTIVKMSNKGVEAARRLALSEKALRFIQKALALES